MSETLFEVTGLRFSYDGVVALDGIDLVISRGSRVALLGANGSGKSTFLRLLDGLEFARHGTVRFAGTALSEAKLELEEFAFAFRRRVGLVFQNPDAQLFNTSVRDELAFGPLQLGWDREHVAVAIEAALRLLDLERLVDRPPHRLSNGEKKRVAIASVLVTDPEVVLFDEPTAALDPKSQSRVIDLLSSWSDGSRTAVTATHDLGIVGEIADRCIVFEEGRIAADGSPAEILADEPLLRRTGLLHAHRHSHASGVTHSHPHVHAHGDHHH